MISLIIGFAIAFVLATIAFRESRSFVRRKLRFVDAAQSPFAPIIAGVAGFVIVGLFAPIIPFVSLGTALSVGVSLGMGVSAGARDARNGYYIAD